MGNEMYSIIIDVPRTRVWDILRTNNTYAEWTSIFCEGSRPETDWKKGNKVLFMDAEAMFGYPALLKICLIGLCPLNTLVMGWWVKVKMPLKGAKQNYTLTELEEKLIYF